MQTREANGLFRVDFQSSDQAALEYSREYELLPGGFAISPGVVVPAGGYADDTSRRSYTLGQQRRVSGRLSAATGSLYGGTRVRPHLQRPLGRGAALLDRAEPDVQLGATCRTATSPRGCVSSRFTVTPSARMLISSLVQFNASAKTLSSSVRLRWEYTGGSELFVVYSDGRDSGKSRVPGAAESHVRDQSDASVQILSDTIASSIGGAEAAPTSRPQAGAQGEAS